MKRKRARKSRGVDRKRDGGGGDVGGRKQGGMGEWIPVRGKGVGGAEKGGNSSRKL